MSRSLPASLTTAPPDAAAAAAQQARATRGWLLGALGVAIFALSIPMTRLAGGTSEDPQLPPAFVAIGRAALAGLLALGYLAWVRAPRPRADQWRPLALAALGVVFGWPLCLGFAVRQVDAVHASVVSGLLPIATAALGAWLLHQRPGRAFWACAVLGTGLVLGFAAWKGGSRLQLADALLVAAVLCSSFGYVWGASLSAPRGDAPPMAPEQVISWILVISLPLTLPLAGVFAPSAPVRASAWLGFGYVSVFSMWLGFFAWYRGLALGGAVRVSQVQLIQPFLSMWLSVPLLGESLDAPTVSFSVAVMATVFLSRRLGRPTPAPRSSR